MAADGRIEPGDMLLQVHVVHVTPVLPLLNMTDKATEFPFLLWSIKNLTVHLFTSLTQVFCESCTVNLPLLFLPVIASLFISARESAAATPTIKHTMADYNLLLPQHSQYNFYFIPIESSLDIRSAAETNVQSFRIILYNYAMSF